MPTIAEQLSKLLSMTPIMKEPKKSEPTDKSKAKNENNKNIKKKRIQPTERRVDFKTGRKIIGSAKTPDKATRKKRPKKISKITPLVKAKSKRPSYTIQEFKEISSQGKIGLGIDRISKINRVRKEDVVIDEHTKPDKEKDRYHALYVAGWSLKK